MGNSESNFIPGGGSEGYHVLRVQPNSPGEAAGLEPFFDFIVAIGNTRLDKDNDTLKRVLEDHIERPLELTVYNSKTQTVRQTQITPSNVWGGQGKLGVSIRFCSFEGANENVWHVISVKPNSPASQAGLISDTDYILGAESVLNQADDLIALVQANEGKPVKLYVYNVKQDNVREVTLTPNSNWGGEGCLGCDIGFGYLHRIPIYYDRSKPISTGVMMDMPVDNTPNTAEYFKKDCEDKNNHQHNHLECDSHSNHGHSHNIPPTEAKAIDEQPVSIFSSIPPPPKPIPQTFEPPTNVPVNLYQNTYGAPPNFPTATVHPTPIVNETHDEESKKLPNIENLNINETTPVNIIPVSETCNENHSQEPKVELQHGQNVSHVMPVQHCESPSYPLASVPPMPQQRQEAHITPKQQNIPLVAPLPREGSTFSQHSYHQTQDNQQNNYFMPPPPVSEPSAYYPSNVSAVPPMPVSNAPYNFQQAQHSSMSGQPSPYQTPTQYYNNQPTNYQNPYYTPTTNYGQTAPPLVPPMFADQHMNITTPPINGMNYNMGYQQPQINFPMPPLSSMGINELVPPPVNMQNEEKS
ncbi:Golgi reassembly-stacking protein 2 [Strongyloides ratti]|uniref:Golgi reassembly-stacking protein 2 n=1 Tax=Strongyloides ratti TaxID=34506 RepID=A0A090L8R1_STRRB|nr:Golgi reassembly-stacking protein 2 [Strongyloides ratti]CEF63885.1 Golgi reassembly-stacking protein 2 [Strongyloides ratti]